MKKKLLTLGALVVAMSAHAQTTYIGNEAKLFVSTDALVYSGGIWMMDSNMAKSVENKGDIIIEQNYVNATGRTTNGSEFVNVYTGSRNYGQVKILLASGIRDAAAQMTVEKPAASSGYYGASYEMSFPYTDRVNSLMSSLGMATSQFKGNCPQNAHCADRYKMTLTKWNNDKLHHDAVFTTDNFVAGDIYNVNLREADMRAAMVNTISYKGTPSGLPYTKTAKGVIAGATEAQFTSAKYNTWKNMINPYNERYQSYMGYVDSEDRLYGKNIYRFGNPYTSNLDLSAFSGDDAWLKILNNNENADLQSATGRLISDFTIKKRMDTYSYTWGNATGSTNANNSFYMAKFDGTQWTGDAEALLIRPTETFELNFPTIYPLALGRTRIVNVSVNFNDNHKTFAHVPSAKNTTSTGLRTSSFRTMAASRSANVGSEFYQLKISLLKDKALVTSPVFLVGTDYYRESGNGATNTSQMFVYGVNNDEIEYNSKKSFNEFNTLSYVGKPLGLGFNNLAEGSEYELKFNLYKDNIFNEIDRDASVLFYLKDTKTNEVVEIDPSKTYRFVADEGIAERLVVYWKEVPNAAKEVAKQEYIDTNKVNELAVSSQNTTIYEEAGKGKIRFENISKTADIQVFNVSGRLVYTKLGVSTSSDYVVNVSTPGMYVVKVAYQNGEVRTLKFVNK